MTEPFHPTAAAIMTLIGTYRDQDKLASAHQLVRSVAVPNAISVALASGRGELIRMIEARPLTQAECQRLYDLIGVLIETNDALRQHLLGVVDLLDLLSDVTTRAPLAALATLPEMTRAIRDFANFRDPAED